MTDPHAADPIDTDPIDADHAAPGDGLEALQRVIATEIPMAASMGVRVEPAAAGAALGLTMPLELNRNHQQTAFAGSLNALCTLAGWGATYLELRRAGAPGVIVIRRSRIKYHRPVDCPLVRAVCLPIDEPRRRYFREMLATKGQSKLDLEVEISPGQAVGAGADRAAVVFTGSYVVLGSNAPSDLD